MLARCSQGAGVRLVGFLQVHLGGRVIYGNAERPAVSRGGWQCRAGLSAGGGHRQAFKAVWALGNSCWGL